MFYIVNTDRTGAQLIIYEKLANAIEGKDDMDLQSSFWPILAVFVFFFLILGNLISFLEEDFYADLELLTLLA